MRKLKVAEGRGRDVMISQVDHGNMLPFNNALHPIQLGIHLIKQMMEEVIIPILRGIQVLDLLSHPFKVLLDIP
jgi:hypothetical protein